MQFFPMNDTFFSGEKNTEQSAKNSLSSGKKQSTLGGLLGTAKNSGKNNFEVIQDEVNKHLANASETKVGLAKRTREQINTHSANIKSNILSQANTHTAPLAKLATMASNAEQNNQLAEQNNRLFVSQTKNNIASVSKTKNDDANVLSTARMPKGMSAALQLAHSSTKTIKTSTTNALVALKDGHINSSSPKQRLGNISDEEMENLSSFIDPDRLIYTGRPNGFSAFESKNMGMQKSKDGTLSIDDVALLKNTLTEMNVPPISVQTFEQLLAENPNATIGRIISTLSGHSRSSLPLDDQERDKAGELLSKLGFSKDEISELLWQAEQGKTQNVWKHVSVKIEALGNSSIPLQKDELSALLRGLDLTKEVQEKVATLFSQNNIEEVNSATFKILLTDASNEMAVKQRAHNILQHALPTAIDTTLQQTKLNEASLPSADFRGDNRSLNQEIRTQVAMKNSFEQKFTNMSDPTSDAKDFADDAADFVAADKAFDEYYRPKKDTKNTVLVADTGVSSLKGTKENTPLQNLFNSFDYSISKNTEMPTQTPSQTQSAHFHRQEIFSQVEQGFMQTLRSGATQISLQINPEHLGQLTIVMTLQEGAVKAVIQAESADTASLLSEQINELKAQLEQNGIKVAELEVQTGIKEEFSSSLHQNSTEHNHMQNAEDRARQMRLAQLRKGNALNDSVQQDISQPSKVETGLHIVA